jgi:hypothetical protein
MYSVRHWSIRHSRFLEGLYRRFESTIAALGPLFERIGYAKLERPVAAFERRVKGLMFDCQMCGQCALSSTGMSCPMNCPKSLRNGPCGGVRGNGNCEVKPEMKCVWVAAWEGSRDMRGGDKILEIQKPVDHSLKGTSSWLKVVRDLRPPKPPEKTKKSA